MLGPTCIFWANLTHFSLQIRRVEEDHARATQKLAQTSRLVKREAMPEEPLPEDARAYAVGDLVSCLYNGEVYYDAVVTEVNTVYRAAHTKKPGGVSLLQSSAVQKALKEKPGPGLRRAGSRLCFLNRRA